MNGENAKMSKYIDVDKIVPWLREEERTAHPVDKNVYKYVREKIEAGFFRFEQGSE